MPSIPSTTYRFRVSAKGISWFGTDTYSHSVCPNRATDLLISSQICTKEDIDPGLGGFRDEDSGVSDGILLKVESSRLESRAHSLLPLAFPPLDLFLPFSYPRKFEEDGSSRIATNTSRTKRTLYVRGRSYVPLVSLPLRLRSIQKKKANGWLGSAKSECSIETDAFLGCVHCTSEGPRPASKVSTLSERLYMRACTVCCAELSINGADGAHRNGKTLVVFDD